MFNPLVLNPAYAGSKEVISSVLLYRNQWVNFDGAPTTLTASINSPLKNKKMGLGFHLISDKIGPTTLTEYVGSYAYRIRVGRGKLSFGLRASIYDFRCDWTKVDYKDKSDVSSFQQQTKSTNTAFDAGVYYYNTSFYAGLAFSHLTSGLKKTVKQSNTFDGAFVPHLTATIGKAFEATPMITFRPSAVLRYTKNAPVSADINISFLLDQKVWIGLGMRSNSDLIFSMEYNLSRNMRMGYSYDSSTRDFQTTNKGTHEFFLGFDIDYFKSKTVSPRIFKYN